MLDGVLLLGIGFLLAAGLMDSKYWSYAVEAGVSEIWGVCFQEEADSSLYTTRVSCQPA